MSDIITGAHGFIGSRLHREMPWTLSIYHHDIQKITHGHNSCRRFFFLSTYGNLSHHEELGAIYKANILDVHHILSKIKPQLFVFFSSSSVTLPVQTPYSISKRCAEHMIENSGVPYLIIRPFSVTGVGEQKEHLIPRLRDSCLNGTRMDFVPEPVHDFVDVEDVVTEVMALSKSGTTGLFEIGNGKPVTNQEVLEIVEKVTGKNANIQIRKQLRAYDNPNWYANIPSMFTRKTLEQSVREMVEVARAK